MFHITGSLTPDTVEDVSPAPRVVCQELGVLYGRLAELAPQVRRGLKQAPEVVSHCIFYRFYSPLDIVKHISYCQYFGPLSAALGNVSLVPE